MRTSGRSRGARAPRPPRRRRPRRPRGRDRRGGRRRAFGRARRRRRGAPSRAREDTTRARHGPSPTHSDPSSNTSRFQIGTSCLSCSMHASHARNAGVRCAAAQAITTAASPGASAPTRWTIATSTRVCARDLRADLGELPLRHRRVRLVLEPDHALAVRLLAHRPGERHDPAAARARHRVHHLGERERAVHDPEAPLALGRAARDRRHDRDLRAVAERRVLGGELLDRPQSGSEGGCGRGRGGPR